ncbi:MAG: YggS family pyridoxal phosphate-dependent enzyme [Ignavibacteriales bacterium]|nr:YggS family pyridoxal phosphate-dependent enzyme [Ignavibacteriales bacterium]
MIAQNIENIKRRIANACEKSGRKPDDITLIAVSKTVGIDLIREGLKSGLLNLGENYIQELREKHAAITDLPVHWHFIGHLQTNKVKYIADWIQMIHAVDSLKLGVEISKYAKRAGRKINILVEVNTSKEETKFGVSADEAHNLVASLFELENIAISGLMTMGPFSYDPEDSRESFRSLKNLRDALEIKNFKLPVLSMGMSNDFEIAIQEGATMVRIGTAIFGQRV